MAKASTIPVILCGGRGSRLWPLSTADMPKVFHCLTGPRSLFQETVLRCQGGPFATRPVVVGAERHRDLIEAQLGEIGVAADIILEPCGRDSLAAVLAGAMATQNSSVDSLILLLAADHYIPDRVAFTTAVIGAEKAALAGLVVTFGITPRHPAEQFGYVQPGLQLDGTEVRQLLQFKEKPCRLEATQLIAAGWLWNSGNFLCRADVLLEAAERLAPDTLRLIALAFANRENGVLEASAFSAVGTRSFDRTIMEKLSIGAVYPTQYQWQDLGTWDAILALETQLM